MMSIANIFDAGVHMNEIAAIREPGIWLVAVFTGASAIAVFGVARKTYGVPAAIAAIIVGNGLGFISSVVIQRPLLIGPELSWHEWNDALRTWDTEFAFAFLSATVGMLCSLFSLALFGRRLRGSGHECSECNLTKK